MNLNAPADPRVTLVTALVDIGRGKLGGVFGRSFEGDDLVHFDRLLRATRHLPMVVYLEPGLKDHLWRARDPANTRLVPLARDDLRRLPHYDRVQEIRVDIDWLGQATWLRWSPQAALPDYNPFAFAKLPWLADQAQLNPFGSSHLFWVDPGLTRTIGEDPLAHPALVERLAALHDFVLVTFPRHGGSDVQGFPAYDLAQAAGLSEVPLVARGGFFGGPVERIPAVADRYAEALERTLADGLMGTEESVLTLLALRDPHLFRLVSVHADGLLQPFFDHLLADDLGALDAPGGSAPPAAPASPVETLDEQPPAEPPTVEPSTVEPARTRSYIVDAEVASRGATSFLGLSMMQNRNAAAVLDQLTRHIERTGAPIARIIELGTGFGGFAAMLQLYCLARGAQFITFDRDGSLGETELFRRLQIDLRVRNVVQEDAIEEIAREAQRPGVTVLFCDGPNKAFEVSTLADYLKSGDVILAHDFAPDRETFERTVRDRLWNWCEITTADVAATIERNELEPLLPDVLLSAAWGGWIKRGQKLKRCSTPARPIDTVAVYVLGYNSPAQFAAWIESVEQAAPELLASPVKVLLNNSTDESTFDAYDSLCERHGFQQHRHGNLGINPGRIWCARHFANDTTCDAMLYFEDDMMLAVDDTTCVNGFRRRVPDLLGLLKQVAYRENLDFLKLSFTELHGDHTQNWAYHNLPEAERPIYFPNGPATHFDAIGSQAGTPYGVGDVFYSNWPMLVTRRGNETLFLEGEIPTFEQLQMVRAMKLVRSGLLRAGVLLASPINHNRFEHYSAEERREC